MTKGPHADGSVGAAHVVAPAAGRSDVTGDEAGTHDGRARCVAGLFVPQRGARRGDWRRPPAGRPTVGRPPNRGWRASDRGSVTAELAAALPALVLLMLAGVIAVSAAGVKVRCVSAARDGALGAARGDDGAAAARRTAPDGASVSVTVEGDVARATVRARVTPFGGLLPAIEVSASAAAAVEPGPP